MARTLRRWTVELDEAAQKIGKPEPRYRVKAGGIYEELPPHGVDPLS